MKKHPMKLLLGLFLIFQILTTSCTRSCKNTDEERPITFDVAFPIESLDSRYATSATASRIAALIFASLFEMDDDTTPKPFLAESIDALDETTFKITLRKDLYFHDNTPLTAHDVVYTYQELSSPDVASPIGEKLEYIEKIEAKDDHTVIFDLKRPYAPFLVDLCGVGIVSKKACFNRSQQCRHELIGSGPYMVKTWDTAKEAVHLVPFPKWFEGSPKSAVLFRVVRDENTRMLELIGKKADIIDGEISPTNILELKKQNHLEVNEVPGLGYYYLAFNVRGPKTEDDQNSAQYLTRKALATKEVRQAIARAIDFDQIIEKLMLNTAKRTSGLIPNSHWAKDENLTPPPFDPKTAELLLDKAGFKRKGEDNMRFKLTISSTPNRLRQNIAQLYADFLKRVGIDAQLRIKDWSSLYQDMKQGQFEMFSATWVPVTDPDLYYFVHHSSSIPEEDKVGGNRHGYKNAEVDRLIEMGRTTMNIEERKVIYQQIERIMLDDVPYIPGWNEFTTSVINRERIKGFIRSPTGSFLGLRKAYLVENSTKKAGS